MYSDQTLSYFDETDNKFKPIEEDYRLYTGSGHVIVFFRDNCGYRVAVVLDKDGVPTDVKV